ncbi:mn2+/Fe2_transporter NRAMP family [Prevotella sp. CAG:732]|nr:mn2+/Fe2_transporter NRAMP family [Prevotella sp. CAG:732]
MKNLIEILRNEGKPKTFGAIDIIKNIGPGLLVTVGFIDPGNWASNFAAGSSYGYVLLWVVTLSTIMLIALQHNVAHLGNNAANIFAIALFLAGISSTITSGMAAGCIFSGMFGEQYYAKDAHSIVGICLSLGLALLVIFFVGNPFKGLLYSQMVLSIQLPFTMFLQVWLTSNSRVMGDYVNHRFTKWWLYFLSAIVTVLNIWLFATAF